MGRNLSDENLNFPSLFGVRTQGKKCSHELPFGRWAAGEQNDRFRTFLYPGGGTKGGSKGG